MVRKLAGGLYTFLPMGLRVLRKVENIIREEMNRAGAIEILMPALQPPEIWQKSGRYETAKDVFFRAKDRADREWVMGPTHEEVVTTLAAAEIGSYKQLPVNFYQIQTKFRDEIRPRFGLMRAKEFIMKDAYSFDASDEAATASYERMKEAYKRIFDRCGLKTIAVEADTGVMGGKLSNEFMVPAETGENDVIYCESGAYAANIEKATSNLPAELAVTGNPDADEGAMPEKFATPGVRTIEALTKDPFLVTAQSQIKTLVLIVEGKAVVFLLRGDHQLNEFKVAGLLKTQEFRPANEDEIHSLLGAHPGSLGAVGVDGVDIYADDILKEAKGMVTGANEDGFHLKNVSISRDITVKKWADIRLVKAGELCPVTGEPLLNQRAIEVGHVFKLGTKYSEALGAFFADENDKQVPAIMGCYGIGVTRTVQAVIEQCNDKNGILWPLSVAPHEVCITALDVEPEGEVMQLANALHDQLLENGIDVILDDRDLRPGVKFKDSELVGFPLRVGIGARSLAEGLVELKPRNGELQKISKDSAFESVIDWIREHRC
jgi:prolyl-tRNA synthetase